MSKYKFSVNDITKAGALLSLMIIGKFISSLLPDLPGGMGGVAFFLEGFIVLGALVLGPKVAITTVAIYVLGIVWIAPTNFIGGIYWVNNSATRFGVYMLDYVLPLMSLSLISLAWKMDKPKILIALAIVIFLEYIWHVFAGVAFWGQYQDGTFLKDMGGGVFIYSAVYNFIRISVLIPSLYIMTSIAIFALMPYLQKNPAW